MMISDSGLLCWVTLYKSLHFTPQSHIHFTLIRVREEAYAKTRAKQRIHFEGKTPNTWLLLRL